MEDTKQIKGKVYKLTSPHTDKVYIGSTIQVLSYRLKMHQSKYKAFINGSGHYRSATEILKYSDVTIELIFEGEFASIDELRKLEGNYIQDLDNCVNKAIPGKLGKERNKAYYANNREK